MKFSRKRNISIGALVVLGVIAVPVYRWVFPPSHQHCIKQAIFLFSAYAAENDGRFPESERGWADALLKLESGNSDYWVPFVVGVDDDGSHLLEALALGADVQEAHCTRVYVQGLSENSPGDTAMLFDRDSEPGGDHLRCRFRDPVREVLTVGGTHKVVKDLDWPEYVESQRKLLLDQGFDEVRIDELYGQNSGVAASPKTYSPE